MSKVELPPLPEPWNYPEWQFTGEQMRAYATLAVLNDREAHKPLRDAFKVLADIPIEDFGKQDKPDYPLIGWNGHELNVSHVLAARAALKGTT